MPVVRSLDLTGDALLMNLQRQDTSGQIFHSAMGEEGSKNASLQCSWHCWPC